MLWPLSFSSVVVVCVVCWLTYPRGTTDGRRKRSDRPSWVCGSGAIQNRHQLRSFPFFSICSLLTLSHPATLSTQRCSFDPHIQHQLESFDSTQEKHYRSFEKRLRNNVENTPSQSTSQNVGLERWDNKNAWQKIEKGNIWTAEVCTLHSFRLYTLSPEQYFFFAAGSNCFYRGGILFQHCILTFWACLDL